ncbi:MAG: hypothetical protein EA419_00135 [Wenzhouxiangella sp.]|nr:MAG: hypothetical protein EA419_00135 [Wenzhouxiangella sp.]
MTRYLAPAAPLALVLALAAAPASAEFEITQWTIASGGVIEATGGDWTLSGTIGQWEATEARALSGGPWRLTGGFWGLSLEELGDILFQDRFSQFYRSRNLVEPEISRATEG